MKPIVSYIVAAFLAICCAPAHAQHDLRSLGTIADPSAQKPSQVTTPDGSGLAPRTDPIRPKKEKEPDTVYCHSTAKRHGWFMPLGMLTKEQAAHRSSSYMFTGKNKQGHWTKMETIDARGRHVPARISPYIMKLNSENDTLVNSEWAKKVGTGCIFEFIPDPSGETIIQERAYDSDYNLIYAYSRTPIGNNQYIGSYRDVHGLPAEMRDEPGYQYGTLVLLTEDAAGNDMKVTYIDSNRKHKRNADGVFAEMYQYDQAGDLVMTYSVDSLGNNVIDDWGNCAMIYSWGDNHCMVSATHADNFLKPMRMMSEKAGDDRGVIKCVCDYDEFSRQTQVRFVDENDNDDVNLAGIHRITYEYDDYGNLLHIKHFDKNNNLTPLDESGTAWISQKYDDNGNRIEAEFFDKSGAPVASPLWFSRIEWKYDDNNNKISEIRWMRNEDGSEKIWYSEVTRQFPSYREDKTTWSDGTSGMIRYDNNNRLISEVYYDVDGSPGLNFDQTWSYAIRDYAELTQRRSQTTTSFYDKKGNLSQEAGLTYNKECEIRDSVNSEVYYLAYRNDTLLRLYSQQYDAGFNTVMSQADVTGLGVNARAGGGFGIRLYKAKVNKSPYTNENSDMGILSLQCLDEFGEPDYIAVKNGLIYSYLRCSVNTSFMSPENEPIGPSEYGDLRDKLPKAMSIEVVDSVAYALGLRDNDVILSFGDYSVNLTNPENEKQFVTDWTIRNLIDANKSRQMSVFRIEDAEAGNYGVVTIPGLRGTPAELGFIPHIRYLTKRQTERILSSIGDESPLEETPLRKHAVTIGYPSMYMEDRYTPYATQVKEAAVVLGAFNSARNLKYDYRDSNNNLSLHQVSSTFSNEANRVPLELTYYFVNKADEVITLTSQEPLSGVAFWSGYVSADDYEALISMYSDAAAKIDAKRSKIRRFAPKQLAGIWVKSNNPKALSGNEEYLSIEPDGKITGKLSSMAYLSDQEINKFGTPIITALKEFSGTWNNVDSLIMVYFQTKSDLNAGCSDVIQPKYDREAIIEYVNHLLSSSIDDYRDKMRPYSGFNGEFFIKSLDKKRMVIDDGCGNETVLVKCSSLPTAFSETQQTALPGKSVAEQ